MGIAIATLSMRQAHMDVTGPRAMGTQYIRQALTESQRVWLAHAKGAGYAAQGSGGATRHHGMGPVRVKAPPASGAAGGAQAALD
jgi:hypothetical protein|mmetsp:Transcript_44675/g.72771  ORF Transcript_44675/g.72771 Transcript_44675/m.72771 type:complete len:85 (+) Transcript_44675:1020-1274(+)|eukprot:CAMPEP_0174348286 /NCGR_PEP_ID=MMETSP0811_2-20130205/4692_1 /TAXON_ID=73025 ORGANISM="Eutreptiella gymnastica-like, Strain CCMP1594" /NCGR_SAMPLE_ID=MMETSP0811_2 /ASSEMBLY_ACC=CAM_ASM_000667 /LENGTH=84 /DNA_ID=CAMNT_0015474683 /DNA_START=975 /DNA_END=1229 /DNA_ORIENTATION=-